MRRPCSVDGCPDSATGGQFVCVFHAAMGPGVPNPEKRRLSPGDSTHVQFRCAQAVRLAVLSRAESEGLTEREAWEAAGRAWADGR